MDNFKSYILVLQFCCKSKKELLYDRQYNSLILLARPARFERAAYGFVVRHSIHLSYGRVDAASKAKKP